MIAPLSDWIGMQRRIVYLVKSPCGVYEIRKCNVAGETKYYPYRRKGTPGLGGPFATADEAFDACAADARKAA